MSGSFNFLLHLLGFGLVSAILTSNIVLEHKLRREPDWNKKLYIGGIMKTISILPPFALVILLVTGIGNIHNLYMGAPESWYTQGWLVVKVILFAVLGTNGLFIGPTFGKRRMPLIKAMSEGSAPPDAAVKLKNLNKQITLFLLVQLTLVLIIIFLSAFGSGKHPGVI
ncbi:MAG: DUF2214 family protein [Ignavibacteriae bacterium]|nr:DUF2214 family protein [Ignavibacteriota bacterium]